MTPQTEVATPSDCRETDAMSAEALRALEQISEAELLELMRKHCQKSWQATRWLLECKNPRRYGKQKGNAASGPGVAAVLDAVMGVVAEEVADDALCARIVARLDPLSAAESVDRPRAALPSRADHEERAAEMACRSHAENAPAPRSQDQAVAPRACAAAGEPPCMPGGNTSAPALSPDGSASDGASQPAPARKPLPPAIRSWIARVQQGQPLHARRRRKQTKRTSKDP